MCSDEGSVSAAMKPTTAVSADYNGSELKTDIGDTYEEDLHVDSVGIIMDSECRRMICQGSKGLKDLQIRLQSLESDIGIQCVVIGAINYASYLLSKYM